MPSTTKIYKKRSNAGERHLCRRSSTARIAKDVESQEDRLSGNRIWRWPVWRNENSLDNTCSKAEFWRRYSADTTVWRRSAIVRGVRSSLLAFGLAAHRLETRLHLRVERGEFGVRGAWLGAQNDIARFRQYRFVLARKHAKATFDGIARHGVADSLGNGQADTSAMLRRGIGHGIVAHQIMHDDVFSRYPTTAFEHRDEIAMAFQPFHHCAPLRSGSEGLAALGAATVDQSAARTGAHALTETVLHVTTAVVRLECPLHN